MLAGSLVLFLAFWVPLNVHQHVPTPDGPMTFMVAVAALLAGYVLFHPGEDPTPAERLGRALARGGGLKTCAVLALAAGAVAVLSWRGVYGGHPIITDSQSQIAQARLLLTGHWRLDVSQTLRDVIAFPYAIAQVPSYAQYPPGYILTLVPVLGLGLPAQTIDILAAAATVALTALLARRVAGRAAAIAAGLLMLGSPFFLLMSGSGMNHTLTAFLLTACACCLLPLLSREADDASARARRGLALAGGFCLGWAVMTRPITGLAHGLVWGGVWLGLLAEPWLRAQGAARRSRLRALLGRGGWIALGLLVPAAIFLYYNTRTTGHPLRLGYQVSNPGLHRLGFHWSGPYRFTPLDALHHLAASGFALNGCLFGWACGSATPLLFWWLRTRLRRRERIVLALILTQGLLYTLYQFFDLLLGPRFLYELLPFLAVLAAAGLAPLLRRGGRAGATLWLVLILLSTFGGFEGYDWWSHKLSLIVTHHQRLESFIQAHLPLPQPTVILLPATYDEMVGRHVPALRGETPLWFILQSRAAQARRLPELAGYQWLQFKN